MPNSLYMRDLILARTLLDQTTLHLSLHADDPGETGAHELSGGDYRRAPLALGRRSAGTGENLLDMDFVRLKPGMVTHFGVWDAERGGHFLLSGPLDTPQQVLDRQSLIWGAGDLVINVG